LTRPFDKHLDSDELDRLVSLHETSASGSEELSEPALREVQRHVESCQNCSQKLQRHQLVHSEILRMRVPNPSPPTPACIGHAEWLEVAAGLLPEAKTRELMKHAAQCGRCGPLLKNASEALVDDATPSEEALLASLQSARPDWRKNMAAALRETVRDQRPKPSGWRAIFAWPIPAYAFAGIVAVALIAWVGVRALHPPSVEQLLAQAYTEHRTLEVRIPDANYAPMQTERGNRQSDFDKPHSLLKAKDLIGEALSKGPNDPKWLQVRARAELLDGNYESAIKSLQRALESEPNSPSVLTDLGSAYFVQAKAANRPVDYGNAVESFGKALSKAPDDPIALFNRALACEQMFLYTQAIEDWQHYLRVDPNSDWSNEARQHLHAIQQKLDRHSRKMAEPLLTPEQIARANDPMLNDQLDQRVEEYLHVAIMSWLPQAFPVVGPPSIDSAKALSVISALLAERHDDIWLSDVLSQPTRHHFAEAIQSLAQALRADDSGDYSNGRKSAKHAATLLQSTGSHAAETRALAEQVYADHLSWESKECLALLDRLSPTLRTAPYQWIRGQMSLERSNCANQAGDMETYRKAILLGRKQAEMHRYPTLFLRAIGFHALSTVSLGDTPRSFELATQGLASYWKGEIELTMGYNLYTDLDSAAGYLREPHLQLAIWREATAIQDQDPDTVKQAMAHHWFAMAAYQAGLNDLAESEFRKSDKCFARSPNTAATIRDRLDAEVWLAKIEALQGDVQQSEQLLARIKQDLDHSPSFDPSIGYYSTLARLSMLKGDAPATDASLRHAIQLGERGLSTLSGVDERRHWLLETHDVYRDATFWKLQQGDTSGALELWEWYEGAEFREPAQQKTAPDDAQTDEPPPLPRPNAVADAAGSIQSETVISYATFREGIAIWLYDDRGIFYRWVALPQTALSDTVLKLTRLCADPTSDLSELNRASRELYKSLIQPLEEYLDTNRTLLFEPDEILNGLPWDVLLDGQERYLGQRFGTAITPGVYWSTHFQRPRKAAIDSAALIVSVPSPAGFPNLTDATLEAESVARMFRDPQLLESDQATPTNISKSLRGKTVFHFAGHAVSSPERTGLVVATDAATNTPSIFGYTDIKPADVGNLQIVVLSACSTSSNLEIGPPDSDAISAGFVRAGVPFVVSSRWQVNSAETAALMATFYQGLLSKHGAATSLKAARTAVAAQPKFSHPYYWSPFSLQERI
jgi:CHAT domain-containing protein/tetratricopeptide (TPR) repeat protein